MTGPEVGPIGDTNLEGRELTPEQNFVNEQFRAFVGQELDPVFDSYNDFNDVSSPDEASKLSDELIERFRQATANLEGPFIKQIRQAQKEKGLGTDEDLDIVIVMDIEHSLRSNLALLAGLREDTRKGELTPSARAVLSKELIFNSASSLYRKKGEMAKSYGPNDSRSAVVTEDLFMEKSVDPIVAQKDLTLFLVIQILSSRGMLGPEWSRARAKIFPNLADPDSKQYDQRRKLIIEAVDVYRDSEEPEDFRGKLATLLGVPRESIQSVQSRGEIRMMSGLIEEYNRIRKNLFKREE